MKEGEVKGKAKKVGFDLQYENMSISNQVANARTHAFIHSLARSSNEEDKIYTYKPTSRSCSAVELETIRTCGFGD